MKYLEIDGGVVIVVDNEPMTITTGDYAFLYDMSGNSLFYWETSNGEPRRYRLEIVGIKDGVIELKLDQILTFCVTINEGLVGDGVPYVVTAGMDGYTRTFCIERCQFMMKPVRGKIDVQT